MLARRALAAERRARPVRRLRGVHAAPYEYSRGRAAAMRRRLRLQRSGAANASRQSVQPGFRTRGPALREYAIAGTQHLDHLARSASCPSISPSSRRHAAARPSRSICPPSRAEERLLRTLQRHAAEWNDILTGSWERVHSSGNGRGHRPMIEPQERLSDAEIGERLRLAREGREDSRRPRPPTSSAPRARRSLPSSKESAESRWTSCKSSPPPTTRRRTRSCAAPPCT